MRFGLRANGFVAIAAIVSIVISACSSPAQTASPSAAASAPPASPSAAATAAATASAATTSAPTTAPSSQAAEGGGTLTAHLYQPFHTFAPWDTSGTGGDLVVESLVWDMLAIYDEKGDVSY